jgi:hypothetical protein
MAEQGENKDNRLTPQGRKNYVKLFDFLSDPDKDWPKRSDYSQLVLKYKKPHQIYSTLTPQIITEIEIKASDVRLERSSGRRMKVRDALYERAIGYSHPDVHIITNRIKTINLDGSITEQTEPLIVPIKKHYPPDPVSGREYLDRIEGKVKEVRDINLKTTLEDLIVGPDE